MLKRDRYKGELAAWNNMLTRAYNDNARTALNTKPAEVCQRWRHSFDNFLEDMGERPANTHFARRDHTQGFYPDNVYWKPYRNGARTPHAKGAGRPAVELVTYKGRTQTIPEWAAELNVTPSTLRYRYDRGWAHEQVLGFEPPPPVRHEMRQGRNPQYFITARGKTQTVKEWCKETGLKDYHIYRRIHCNWSHENIVNTPPGTRGKQL